jgi:hypothetical protein
MDARTYADFSIFTRIVSFYVQCLPCVYSTSDFSVTTQNLPDQAFKLKEFTNIIQYNIRLWAL